MALDASTLEWIRRLPDELGVEDLATLQVLRRQATGPSDVRLLDSLLAGVGERQEADRKQAEASRRAAHLREEREPANQARTEQQREQAVKQLAQSLREKLRVPPAEAERRARQSLTRSWNDQDRHDAAELRELRNAQASHAG
jgi:hypothetical protein